MKDLVDRYGITLLVALICSGIFVFAVATIVERDTGAVLSREYTNVSSTATTLESTDTAFASTSEREEAPTPTAEMTTDTPAEEVVTVSAAEHTRESTVSVVNATSSTEAVELPPQQDVKPHSYETALALEVHRLTNKERRDRGLSPLIYDARLAHIAKKHSEDMLEENYFEHVTPGGCDVWCRLQRGGYSALSWSENIAWRLDSELPGAEAVAEYLFENWMDSTSHRVNIISEDMTHEGVGVVRDGNVVYVTVDFALPE